MPKLTEDEAFNQEVWDRRARERAAWGVFGACARMQNFKHNLAEMDQAVKQAPSEEKRKEAEGKKKKFVDEARTANASGFYIG